MSQYVILIYGPEGNSDAMSPEEWQQAMVAHGRFAEQVVEMGAKILGGEALQPSTTATSIRGDVVTDGPFVETKEVLGGFYLVDASDLDQALAIGKLCPSHGGGVEVRPIMDTSGG